MSVTFGGAKQQVYLIAGANKITNTHLGKRGVGVCIHLACRMLMPEGIMEAG